VALVIVGLVAMRTNDAWRKSLNSYVPGVDGSVTDHVLVVTPAPT
jgi:hypothetical protein